MDLNGKNLHEVYLKSGFVVRTNVGINAICSHEDHDVFATYAQPEMLSRASCHQSLLYPSKCSYFVHILSIAITGLMSNGG